MVAGETELEMVERHVREGERHVARQREIVAEMLARGQATDTAEQLLSDFEGLLAEHRRHLDRLKS